MKIAKISGHGCIRMQKEALALLDKGHDVHIIAGKVPYNFQHFKSFSYCAGIGQFLESIELYASKVDLFHVHNEPSWFVTAIKERSDIPVILDIHDSYLARITPDEHVKAVEAGEPSMRILTEERNNFQLADGLVFPSEPFGKLVKKEFSLKQPSLILPSYVPERMYRYDCREWLGGLVYEGRVDLEKDVERGSKLHSFRYCQYEDAAREARKLGIDFFIYSTRTDQVYIDTMQDIAFLNKPLQPDELFKKLTRHDWGLVGNVFPTPEWDVALPNKLFEYLAACVPVVAINAAECGRFLEQHGIGIAVESLEELRDRWSEHTEVRKVLIRKRKRFTMESNIHQLERLYYDCCK